MSIKKKFLVDIDLDNNQINNVAAPQVSGDVATYEWVTGLISAEEAARGASFSTVDGKIKDIISNLDITAVDSFTEVVTKINADITAEAGARLAADSAESAARIAADSAESAARIAADASESASRIAADSAITSAYTAADSAESVARIAGDDAEASARSLADTTLQGNINVEKGRVDAILLASDADKNSFAEIVTLINSVDTSNDETFAGYVLSNNAAVAAEIANRITDVNAEETRAIAAEGAEATARIAADGVLQTNIDAEATARIADVNAEETRALAAEALIQADIDAEVSRMDSRDLATEVRIYNLEGVVSVETANRISDVNAEETRAIADVDAEETRALAAEGVLQTNISAEAASRIAGDSAEATRALAAEGVLQTNINTEKAKIDAILLASDADKDSFAEIVTLINSVDTANDSAFAGYVLSNNAAVAANAITAAADVDSEETRALDAEALLSGRITSEVADRIADVDAEETRALAAESALQGNIDTLNSAAIKTASNGLTEIDNNVKLGGAITAATDITGNFPLNLGISTNRLGAIGINGTTLSASTTSTLSLLGNTVTISTQLGQGNLTLGGTSGPALSSGGGIQSVKLTNTAGTGGIINTATVGPITNTSVSMGITTTGLLGAVYAADYSATFVNNSLVSKLYVTNQIAAEALLARAAEGVLTTAVNTEKGRIDAILLASDADKNSFAEIVTLINSVDTTNDEAFAGYVLLNNAAVAAEIARATADVDSEETRALAAEALLSGRITSEVADRIADVNAEETRALAAEGAEETRALAAEGVLQGNIDTLNSAAIKTASNGLTEVDNNVKLGGALLSGDTVFTGAAGNVEVKFGNSGGEISRFWIKATGEIYNVTEYGVITTSSEYGAINTTATRGNITTTATEGSITDSSASMSITTTGGLGAVYSADYSAGFVNNSLVSKLYVTNQIAAEALSLQSDIDAVTANVDAILLASDADKNSFAEIVTLINSVDATSDSAFAGYVLSNNDALALEVANRISDVNAEETRAIAAEGVLSASITSEATTARAAEGVLTSNLASAKTIIADRMNITPVVSSFTIGNGLTHSFVLEHSLGTTDVIIQVYNVATGQTVETSAIRVGLQTISIEFASAPALNSYKVVTMGIKAFAFSGLMGS